MPTPAPTGYYTTGTYTNYGGYGTFQGTTTPSGGFASGYAAGANMGANIANAYALSAARDHEEKLTAACMRTLGWIDTSTPEGQTQFKQAAAKSAPQTASSDEEKVEREKWVATINAFVESEAARPGGIDYRADKGKQLLLDKYVKELANAPENETKTSTWFLIEANRKVRQDYGLAN